MYLKAKHPEKKRVYALGKSVLADELKEAGFDVLSSQEHNYNYENFSYHDVKKVDSYLDIEAVVQGYDDKINLFKLSFASFCV